jgi:phosphoglycerate dehydrogenase-like enzyme
MRIASLDVWTPRIQDIVREALPRGYDIAFASSYARDEQLALAHGADAILAGWAEVDGEMIRSAPGLRVIQKWGIGVDRIDLHTAAAEGVAVAIAAGCNASPVAEHTIMLMLSVYRRLSEVDRSMRDGRWIFSEMRERCYSLRGKTVGLVGLGNIGRSVARKLSGFEVDVTYYDPRRPEASVESALGATFVPMDRLLAESDVISLHLPGGAENRHLFGAKAFSRLKRGAILINTARGDLVDEDALCDAVESGHLMGAGLDVYEPEPPVPGSRLTRFDQVVLTPHTAGSVIDNVEHVAAHVFGNIDAILNGRPISAADRVVTPESGGRVRVRSGAADPARSTV